MGLLETAEAEESTGAEPFLFRLGFKKINQNTRNFGEQFTDLTDTILFILSISRQGVSCNFLNDFPYTQSSTCLAALGHSNSSPQHHPPPPFFRDVSFPSSSSSRCERRRRKSFFGSLPTFSFATFFYYSIGWMDCEARTPAAIEGGAKGCSCLFFVQKVHERYVLFLMSWSFREDASSCFGMTLRRQFSLHALWEDNLFLHPCRPCIFFFAEASSSSFPPP